MLDGGDLLPPGVEDFMVADVSRCRNRGLSRQAIYLGEVFLQPGSIHDHTYDQLREETDSQALTGKILSCRSIEYTISRDEGTSHVALTI